MVSMLMFPPAAFGNLLGSDFFVISLFWLVATVFWFWMLVDCLMSKSLKDAEKIVWVLVLLFTNVIGAALYFFIGRGKVRTSL